MKTIVKIKNNIRVVNADKSNVKITILPENQKPATLLGEVEIKSK